MAILDKTNGIDWFEKARSALEKVKDDPKNEFAVANFYKYSAAALGIDAVPAQIVELTAMSNTFTQAEEEELLTLRKAHVGKHNNLADLIKERLDNSDLIYKKVRKKYFDAAIEAGHDARSAATLVSQAFPNSQLVDEKSIAKAISSPFVTPEEKEEILNHIKFADVTQPGTLDNFKGELEHLQDSGWKLPHLEPLKPSLEMITSTAGSPTAARNAKTAPIVTETASHTEMKIPKELEGYDWKAAYEKVAAIAAQKPEHKTIQETLKIARQASEGKITPKAIELALKDIEQQKAAAAEAIRATPAVVETVKTELNQVIIPKELEGYDWKAAYEKVAAIAAQKPEHQTIKKTLEIARQASEGKITPKAIELALKDIEQQKAAAAEAIRATPAVVETVKTELKVDPKVDPKVEPEIEPEVDPKIEPEVDPKIEPEVDPKVEPEVDPKVEPEVDPKVEPEVDPKVEPEVDPKAESEVDPKAESEVHPKAEPSLKSAAASEEKWWGAKLWDSVAGEAPSTKIAAGDRSISRMSPEPNFLDKNGKALAIGGAIVGAGYVLNELRKREAQTTAAGTQNQL